MSEITPTTFKFTTDEDARAYLQKNFERMVKLFNVSQEDCIECINEAWSNLPICWRGFSVSRVTRILANHFIFRKESYWWIQNRQGHKILKPLPYWIDKIDKYKNLN
jgi:hypothetical protein